MKRIIAILMLLASTGTLFAQSSATYLKLRVVDSLRVGEKSIRNFSDDPTLADSSTSIVPTQSAVKGAISELKLTLDGKAPASGSPNYIRNDVSGVQGGGFRISGNASIGENLRIGDAGTPSSNGLQVVNRPIVVSNTSEAWVRLIGGDQDLRLTAVPGIGGGFSIRNGSLQDMLTVTSGGNLSIPGRASGANALSGNEYVTRQQMTDSINGRPATDMYYADGTITDNRVVSTGGRSLTFEGGVSASSRTSYFQNMSYINLNKFGVSDSVNLRLSTAQIQLYSRSPTSTSTYIFGPASHAFTTNHTAVGRSVSISTQSSSNSIKLAVSPVGGGEHSLILDSASAKISSRVRIGGGSDDPSKRLNVNGDGSFVGTVSAAVASSGSHLVPMQQMTDSLNARFAQPSQSVRFVRQTSVNTTFLPTDYLIVATVGGLTLTLPPAASVPNQTFVAKAGFGEVTGLTVTTTGGELIDSSTTATTSTGPSYTYGTIIVMSDGVKWWRIRSI